MSTQNTTYGGRYAVEEKVGTGGMAEVYRARDELLGREVALKVLSHRFSNDRSFIERFRREAQAAAGLNHPNIVSLYDYGSEDGDYFIVMEYIQGKSLETIIDEGRLLPERAAEIAAGVARALERAHVGGLVHRDIKPANIMLTDSGDVKVTDFGIVRALARDGEATMTQTGMVIGTAAYLSPEQAQGHPVDARSDVYSLGVVLYEMLTGEPPFTGDTPLSVAYKHVRENPQPPNALNPDIPESLNAIAMKAIAKNPDNRYSTAAEMREDLERYLGGQTVAATPVIADETAVAPAAGDGGTRMMTAVEEPYRPPPEEEPRRRPWWPVLLVLLLLAAAAIAAFLVASHLLEPTVTVPDVTGEKVKAAIADLKARNLDFKKNEQPNRATSGEVFDQDPNKGATLHEGDPVTLFVSTGPRQVSVPNLVGLTRGEAQQKLKDHHLKLGEVSSEASDTVDKGHVIRQEFPGGDRVTVDTSVGITISSGSATVTVPNVVGESEDQARSDLEAVGLQPSFTTQASTDVPKGEVISQAPAGGSSATKGDTISVLVSTGPEAQSMPNVVGQPSGQARATLENDFGLTVTESEGNCTQPPGTVCDQTPKPGAQVSPGDSATLFVQPNGSPTGAIDLRSLLDLFRF